MARIDNNYFTYRQTPTTENGTGTFESIKGNTLVWNQLVQNGNFADGTNGWRKSATADSISVSNNILSFHTSVVYGSVSNALPIDVNNHVVVVKAQVRTQGNSGIVRAKLVNNFGYTNNTFAFSIEQVNVWTDVLMYGTYTTTPQGSTESPKIGFADYRTVNSSNLIEVKNVQVFDLTIMGLDITTSEFNSLFSLPYYAYNQGSLLSFMGNGIKTVGKNLLPLPIAETKNGITLTHNNDGSITLKGTTTANTYFDFSTNFDSSKYEGCLFTCRTSQTIVANVTYRISKNDRVGIQDFYTNVEGTIQNKGDGLYFAIRIAGNVQMPTDGYTLYPMLRMPNQDTTFEPYTSSALSLPISTYFPNGMNGFGGVYDEITESKAITRITKIVLDGTENWTTETFQGVKAFYIKLSDGTYANWDANKVYCKCDRFEGTYYNYASSRAFGQITMTGRGEYIEIMADFADVASFKTWLTSNPTTVLYVSKAPTETDISPELDLTFNIDVGGTEELLPTNTSTPTTTPILCDILYRGLIPVSVTVYPLGAGTVEGAGQYRYGETVTLVAESSDGIYRFLRYEDENGQTLSTDATYSFIAGE